MMEKLQRDHLTSKRATASTASVREAAGVGGVGGVCVCECFTLCRLGSLGHRSPSAVLFTALPPHEVSLPGLPGGQSSSVSTLVSRMPSCRGTAAGDCGPSQGPNGFPSLPPTLQSFISENEHFCELFFLWFLFVFLYLGCVRWGECMLRVPL